MGTKYTTNAVASYNASPPSDAGAATEENRVTWAKTKTKLSDPLKTTIDAIDADLVEAFDVGPVSKSVDYTTVAGDHNKTISCTAALTVTLIDAATAAVGYTVNISNQSTGNVTVGRATSGNTINGTAANVTITRGNAMTLRVNTAANGYEVINTSLKDIAGLAKTDGNIVVGDGTNWVAESGATARASLGAAGTEVANTFTANQTVTSVSEGTVGPIAILYQNSASPAADDAVGVISFDGRNSTPARITYGSERVMIVDPTAGSEDGRFAWVTYVAGAATFRMYLGAGLYSANATGGDKGVDTANFSAVYDDNVLLTCYAIDAYKTGSVDIAYWDSVTPDLEIAAQPEQAENRPVTRKVMRTQRVRDGARIIERLVAVDEPVYDELPVFDGAGKPLKSADGRPLTDRVLRVERVVTAPAQAARTEVRTHAPAAKFAPRAAELLDPKAYGAAWKATGHLPAMPSPAEWVAADKKMAVGDILQRLWECTEIQAIHIDKLLARIEALEAQLAP